MINMMQGDCLPFMREKPDNYYKLGIIDPPYGINVITGRSFGDPLRKDGSIRHGIDKRNGSKITRKASEYKQNDWDKSPPSDEYFKELFRITENQIIWGANHFISKIPFDSSCWIVWDKVNGSNDFADCELAWTSFKTAVRKYSFMWNGMLQGSSKDGKTMEGSNSKRVKRIHPTEKPIQLYEWLLMNYAKPGDKILDTHGGSGSSAIAAWNMGYYMDWIELDPDYYRDACRRFEAHKSQLRMFTPDQPDPSEPVKLF